jgi:hypothetical protein
MIRLAHNAGYELRAKKRPQDFTRNRKMTFAELMYFMPGMAKESSQNALSRFFHRAGKAHIQMR